ncbi:MAG: hypothetical protein ACHQYQ_08220 [Bacteriovoracales bacterium]
MVSTFLITGDDKAQFNSVYSYNRANFDIDQNGYWRERNYSESLETLRLETAHIIFDRWQAGISLPFIRRTRGNETSSGVGDLSTNLGYEYLPDWNYNPFRPKGIAYLNLIIPTGTSLQEANQIFLLDANGRGFWTLGVGTLLTKGWGNWDAFVDLGFHKSFSREFQNSQTQVSLDPGWGENLAIGGGINFSSLRLGISMTWINEDEISSHGSVNSGGAKQRYTSLDFPLTYFISDEWMTVIKYSDKGLFGNPLNTSLDKGVAFQIQRKWPR